MLWTQEAFEEAKRKMGEELYRDRKPRPFDPTEPTEMEPGGSLDTEFMERLRALYERAVQAELREAGVRVSLVIRG